MCGIAGYIARLGFPVDELKLKDMCDAVKHRGPDGYGASIVDAVGLGHRRLSILDVSDDGSQPMEDPETGRRIVFNGEIYNYIELRKELIDVGKRFRSGTDTEVILAAYDVWGSDCVSRFNGMWAFAIHDPERDIVFCSRDRFGIKPFYFADLPNCFAFSSEIRQILPILKSVRANEKILQDFLFANISEPQGETFFEDVQKLNAGCNLIYRLSDSQFYVQKYYELIRRKEFEDLSFEDAKDLYRSIFTESVGIRLRSDVSVGACLSGGLDSSSVATVAAGLYSPEDKSSFSAVTAVSEDPVNDESHYARRVVDHAKLNWFTTKPDYEAFNASLGDVVAAQEEPFAGPSICMQFFVMQAARAAGVKVMLDGQGGDETLLGYERYFAAHFSTSLKRDGLLSMSLSMMSCFKNNATMSPWMIAAYYAYFTLPRLRYWHYKRRHRYLKRQPAMPEVLRRYAQESSDEFSLQQLEIESTNLPSLLRYEDKNSMWHGVETRLPFLDYRLVELALSMRGSYKIQSGWTKYVLRQGMSGVLPEEITWRRDKRGFEAPENLWLKQHRPIMRNAVMNSKILKKLCSSKYLSSHYYLLDKSTQWRLYSVALWEQKFDVEL